MKAVVLIPIVVITTASIYSIPINQNYDFVFEVGKDFTQFIKFPEYLVKHFTFSECTEPNQVRSSCAKECDQHCSNFIGENCPIIYDRCIINTCVCQNGTALIEPNKCIPIESKECGAIIEPVMWRD